MVDFIVTPKRREIFWRNVSVSTADACWLWQRSRNAKGYGSTQINGHTHNASRVAYILTHGAIPENSDVCHHCDNPPCCNPAHLFLGTRRDNMVDKSVKGRASKGERHRSARLTSEQVIEMRQRSELGESYIALSKAFGIARQNIRAICLRRLWRHLP